MSRHASRFRVRSRGCAAAVLALVAPLAPLAGAQTIADYSRAQRALLENAMAQAAARAAGASTSPAPTPAPSAAAAAAQTLPTPHPGLPQPQPDVQVSGVFASGAGAIAEVLVNGTPYLLASGEQVPGTAWRVQSSAVDRVVLARRNGPEAGAPGAVRVFALPALH